MRYISIFSGIEAATVAWEPLGWEPVAFCEIDAFPSAVLAHRFPNVPNLGDITEVDWKEVVDEYGTVDIVIGGSPCQSFSIAGGRDSLRGESRLCFEFVRCIGEVAPTWFVWENVPGVFSTRDNAFGQFLGALEELGYGMAWRTLDAQFYGVAQRRRRVFLIGHAGGMVGAASAVLFERESVSGNTKPSRAKREELARAAGERFESGGGCLTRWDVQSRRIFGTECAGPTLQAGSGANVTPFVLAFNDGQITSKANGNNPQFGDPCHTLDASYGHAPCIAIQGDGSTSRNSHGDGYQTDGSSYMLNCIDRHSVMCMQTGGDVAASLRASGGAPSYDTGDNAVMCMATAQANAEILSDVSPTVVAGQEHQIVCMTGDTGKAAVDTDLCGTLHVGGGSPLIASVRSAQGTTRASGTSTSKKGN